MTTIKTLLVDDEYLALNLLEGFVNQIPDMEVIAKLKSPLKALEVLNQTKVDLLFLDIQMPTLSGNQLLKTLKHPPLTVFTTAYTDYAIEAFDLNVVDYLLKPFSFERFLQAVNKAREQLRLQQEVPVSGFAISPDQTDQFFTIKADGKFTKVRYDDILYIEGLKEYVRIVCTHSRHVILESLKNLEGSLPASQFLRVHKSYIVAKNKVQSVEGNLLEIGTTKIPISRSKREEVIQAIFYQ